MSAVGKDVWRGGCCEMALPSEGGRSVASGDGIEEIEVRSVEEGEDGTAVVDVGLFGVVVDAVVAVDTTPPPPPPPEEIRVHIKL